ncbi:MAG: hypothetical protein HOW73_07550 [Polyangiaceae bacterium]|nr:hypothetical protein [Polyangiaceae bacterium]
MRFALASLLLASLSLVACSDDSIESDESDVTSAVPETTVEAQALRALLNDPATTQEVLTKGKVTSSAAKALLAHRNGVDGAIRTSDDDLFDTVAEVDAVKNVGPATLQRLVTIATDRGYLAAEKAKKRSIVFSPQAAAQSHNAEIAKVIGQAKTSIDIAMYSFSDAGISAALDAAVKRGVKVRFVFETAGEDRKLTGGAIATSKSGKLEALGVDVRWVNKIMHHKFMIVDGARDDAEAAKTATIVSGSGNWSSGAATIYDENTMFMTGYPELSLRLQKEFNLMWEHSTDFVSNSSLVFEPSTLALTEESMPLTPGMQIFFTSDNFTVKNATFSVTSKNTVSDELVRAIDAAEDRIHIASGHLRSRPVAEAIIRKVTEEPDVDVMIYLDGQEYVSDATNAQQIEDRDECLAAATTDAQKRACVDKSFLYGREVEKAGASVRYKYYAYRWDTSYAAQMHNKVLIVDDALYTGSYNLSDNAEHNTFENMFMFRGPEFRDLVEQYETQFQKLWVTGDGLLDGLRSDIETKSTIPIVFPAMSLSWAEVRDLKSLIAAECPDVNSSEFRTNAPAHKTCTK